MVGGGPTTSWGWPEELGRSLIARQRLNAIEGDVSPLTVPGAAATDQQLASAEQRLGHAVDGLHRQLLSHANGWPDFFNSMHLFSADAFGSTDESTPASGVDSLLDVMFRDAPAIPGLPPRNDLLPIAANPSEVADVLVLWRVGPVTDGGRPVSWLAEGEEVQRFDNCWDLLVSVDTYLEGDIAEANNPGTSR